MATDAFFGQVPLLLTFNGAHNSTTFTDLSYTPKTVTVPSGDAKVTTSVTDPFGGTPGVGTFDGTGDYINVATSTAFDLGTSNFTIDLWVRAGTATPAQSKVLISKGWASAAAGAAWKISQETDGGFKFFASTTTASWDICNPLLIKAAPSINTWYHLSVVRTGTLFVAYCDGVATSSVTSALAIRTDTTPIYIGGSTTSGDSFDGQIDSLRINNAIARYPTMTTPTAAFGDDITADPSFNSTVLLLHGNGSNGSTTFTDSSFSPKSGFTIGGAAQISTTAPKFGTGSMSFTAGTSAITIPTSTDFDLGTTYTVECWVNPTNITGNQGLFNRGFYTTGSATWAGLTFGVRSFSGVLRVYFYGTTLGDEQYTDAASALTAGAWQHLAIVRSGTTGYLFIDGVLKGVKTGLNTPAVSTETLRIGKWDYSAGTEWFTGNMDDLRITKGVARYPIGFTVPTEEYAVPPPEVMTATLTAPVSTVAAYFGDFATLSAPQGALAAYTGMTGAMTAPMGVIAQTAGSTVALTAPMGVIVMTGHDATGENAAYLSAPKGLVGAYFGAVAKLSAPMGVLAATGTVSGRLTAELTAPMGDVASTGTGSPYVMTAALTAPMGRMIGYGGAVAAIISPMGFVTSTGTTGGKLSAAIVAPLFELTATITRGQTMSAELIAPMLHPVGSLQAYLMAPMGQLTAIGHAVVTATYEAYAINLKHVPVRGVEPVDEVTRYTSFPFTHIVRYKNSYFGVGSDGNLYLLEGTTDNATPISWAWKTALDDFKTPNKKTLYSVNFSGRVGPAATITAYLGESGSNAYSYTTPRDALPQNYRQLFGKGMKDRYYALGATGDGDLMLDDMTPNHAVLARKI